MNLFFLQVIIDSSKIKDSLARATSSHLSGHLIFGQLAERTGDARYVQLVRKAADLGFTESGVMKESMPLHNEMSDSVFMGCPILAKVGKLTQEQERHMPQMHPFASLDGERCNVLRHALRSQVGNPLADFHAVLVELRLPQEAREHRATQTGEDADVMGPCTLVSRERGTLCVCTHLSLLSELLVTSYELRRTIDHGCAFSAYHT
jgi:hypothetical protein